MCLKIHSLKAWLLIIDIYSISCTEYFGHLNESEILVHSILVIIPLVICFSLGRSRANEKCLRFNLQQNDPKFSDFKKS